MWSCVRVDGNSHHVCVYYLLARARAFLLRERERECTVPPVNMMNDRMKMKPP